MLTGAGARVATASERPPAPVAPAHQIGPGSQQGGPDEETVAWAAPTFAGASRSSDLLAVEHCCDVVHGYGDVESSRVLAVDPYTGIVLRTVMDAAGLLTWLDADATGEQVLLVATSPQVDGTTARQDRLLVLDAATGAAEPLREGITTASW